MMDDDEPTPEEALAGLALIAAAVIVICLIVYILWGPVMEEPNLSAKIRSVETLAEMDALVAALYAVAPIGGDVRSMIALRRIELQMAAQKVRE